MTGQFLRSLGIGSRAAHRCPAVALAQERRRARAIRVPGQIGLQQSVTPIMDSIHAFHDGILMWTISLIMLLVLALLVIVMVRFNAKRQPDALDAPPTTRWSRSSGRCCRSSILVVIAIPSFGVLTDQLTMPDGAAQISRHQHLLVRRSRSSGARR